MCLGKEDKIWERSHLFVQQTDWVHALVISAIGLKQLHVHVLICTYRRSLDAFRTEAHMQGGFKFKTQKHIGKAKKTATKPKAQERQEAGPASEILRQTGRLIGERQLFRDEWPYGFFRSS
jgi:hypothetical protein